MSKKVALVTLQPVDVRSAGAVNLGYYAVKETFIKEGWEVDEYTCKEWYIPNPYEYDIIAFSVYYYTQLINLLPFLKRNHIPYRRTDRRPTILVGGQGCQNNLLNDYIDVVSMGACEISLPFILENHRDLELLSTHPNVFVPSIDKDISTKELGYYDKVDSPVVIYGKNAVVQISHGCRYRCKFCGYSWSVGKYKEKPIEVVKEQLLEAKSKGVTGVNLFSADMTGYSHIIELLDFMIEHNIRILNTDIRASGYTEEIAERLDKLKFRRASIGVESFDESVRQGINKRLTDQQLEECIDRAIRHNVSTLHLYLIAGLPNEQYNHWIEWFEKIKARVEEEERSIRVDFSIQNFQPMQYTPLKDFPFVDFNEKHKFVRKFLQCKYKLGWLSRPAEEKDYCNLGGKIGMKECSYLVTMFVLHGDSTGGNVLEELDMKTFIGRSINPKLYSKIRAVCERHPEWYQIKKVDNPEKGVWED